MKVELNIELENTIGKIDKRLFSSFLEHLGRAIYGGIYEPAHPAADENGLRQDVIDLVKELQVPMVRYPGGNFVSGYQWEDGVGPIENRPIRLDLAWRALEPNEFGLNEFIQWTRKVGAEPMMAVNLGTRGPADAARLVEYCNHPGGTTLSELRKKHGYQEPHHIKTWCLGNEMDGPWQIGTKSAQEYACIAKEAAKQMKWVDPEIELVACGSSYREMPTFGKWEETIARICYDEIDYISLHQYYDNLDKDTPSFLASTLDMDDFITEVVEILDRVKKDLKKEKTLYLSFDEWNVWYHSKEQDERLIPWQIGPRQLEDIYTFEDALVVGLMMMTLIKHADRVKIACFAQLVNVIAPIMTEPGTGSIWRQTIFYPLFYMSRYGRGTAIKIDVQSPTYHCARRNSVPFVDAVGVQQQGELSVFLVNRSLEETAELEIEIPGEWEMAEWVELYAQDIKETNSFDKPDNVKPQKRDCEKRVVLKEHSWNMIRYRKKAR